MNFREFRGSRDFRREVLILDYDNIINKRMIKLKMTNKQAAEAISKTYKVEMNEKIFGLIKLGYYVGHEKRTMVADFFGIPESKMPRKGQHNDNRKRRKVAKK